MARRKKSRIVVLFKLVCLCAVLFALAFAGLFGYQLWLEHHIPQAKEDSLAPIIVLGAQIKPDGTPNVQLEWRLERALTEYLKNPRAIVVCGAQGANEPTTEASAMKTWLTERGVKAEDLLADDTSFNTKENLANALRLLPEGIKEVTVVTSDYHLPRALQIARDMGLEPTGLASPIKAEYWLKNHVRETLAWGKYFLGRLLPFSFL